MKNTLGGDGELVIVERPGTTNLYFVAVHGQPLGPQGEYQTTKRSQHEPGCPLRDPALRQQCARLVQRSVDNELEEVSEISDGEGQESLTQKTPDNKREKQWRLRRPISLSPQDGADAPEQPYIAPEVARKFGRCYGVDDWAPRRREVVSPEGDGS